MRWWREWLLFLMMTALLIGPAMAEDAENLLENGGFETLDGREMPSGWYEDAYIRQEGYTLWSVSEDAHTGQYSAEVQNFGENDARFAQQVNVEPNAYYRFSGYIKVLEMTDTGWGANLSVEGLYAYSEQLHNISDGWTYVELYGQTGPEQHEVTLFARVGGYSGESVGAARFDDLRLEKLVALPGNVAARPWYTAQTTQAVETEEATPAQPAWPWLLLICAVYAGLGWWMSRWMQVDRRALKESRRAPAFFLIGLAVAAAARIATALLVEGYQVDVNCFRAWSQTIAEVGPSMFYQTTSFCDYTPGYLYVLAFNSLLGNTVFAQKLVPMCCDLIMAYFLYAFARKRDFSRDQAGMLGLLFALNPAMALNSAGWCQIDSVLCLGLMLVAVLAIEGKWAAALPVYVFSALVKPQALMLGPLGLLAILLTLVQTGKKNPTERKQVVRSMLMGLGVSAAVALVVILPFSIHQEKPTWLFELYQNTLASYPYATVNTTNLYYLLDANWVSIDSLCGWVGPTVLAVMAGAWCVYLFTRQKGKPLYYLESILMAGFAMAYVAMAVVNVSWTVLGATAMVMSFVMVLACYLRSGKIEHLPLCGAVLFLLLYTLGIKMHERYLFPALILLALAYALHRDRRVLMLLVAASCAMVINEGIVLDNSLRLGSSMGHLNNDTLLLNDLTSLVNVAVTLIGVWVCHDVCVLGAEERLDEKMRPLRVPKYAAVPQTAMPFQTSAKRVWTRLDALLVLSVTLAYSVLTLTTLGSTKAPQTSWKSSAMDESVIIDLGAHYDNFKMLYFCQVSYKDFTVAVSEDDAAWSEEKLVEMKQGLCYRWKYFTSATGSYDASGAMTFSSLPQALSGRYVRITSAQVGLILNEVIFRDAQGERIPATVLRSENGNPNSPNYSDPSCVLDEQDTLEGEPSWWNGTYFDEIYHARTAYEHLHGQAPYETSHPPLGKLIMAVGVAIFGMTPFGWRFAGALTGILMLPVMYALGKQLTNRTSIALTAMMLMTLDLMHFTQTRIATIDSFPVFFIMLSWLFMLRFIQRDITKEPMKRILPDLALSGFFMGCGIASKWIGVYSGIGLAVVYFWTCARHFRLRGKAAFQRIFHLCLWCLLFFVAIPLAIYLLSYVPYFAYAYKENVFDFLKKVWDANFGPYGMLAYHSEPGRGMDHPFYTPWYDWPLMRKPMYYASPAFTPEGWSYAIWCLGNPAVWFVGVAGVAGVAAVWAKRHVYYLPDSRRPVHLYANTWDVAPAFMLIGLLAQFLPWTLVPRGTYIYHYFASLPFLMLAISLCLHWIQEKNPRLGRNIIIGYLIVCAFCFILYFPYASGLLTPTWWLNLLNGSMRKIINVYY